MFRKMKNYYREWSWGRGGGEQQEEGKEEKRGGKKLS